MFDRRLVLALAAGLCALALSACTPPPTPAGAPAAPSDPAAQGATGAVTTTAGLTTTSLTTGTGQAAAAASVVFAKPMAGAAVASPVEVCLTATGVTIEKAGAITPGAGHHHLLLDPTVDDVRSITAVPAVPIAKDATHVHLGDGSSCTSLELAPGEHTVVAVVGDGAHFPLRPPVTATVTFQVQ